MTVRILTGDCIDVMRTLGNESIDAIVTDPPYCAGSVSEASRTAAPGQGIRSENLRRMGWFVGDNMGTAGIVWLLRAVAFESCRLLRPSGSLLCFMDWRQVSNIAPAIESAGLRFQNLIVWDKCSLGLGTGFRSTHEMVGHFTNGAPVYHDASRGNVLRHPRVRAADREHQTQKPLELLRDLLRVVVPPGGNGARPVLRQRDDARCSGHARHERGRHRARCGVREDRRGADQGGSTPVFVCSHGR